MDELLVRMGGVHTRDCSPADHFVVDEGREEGCGCGELTDERRDIDDENMECGRCSATVPIRRRRRMEVVEDGRCPYQGLLPG
jgi:hypothetical protein